MQNPIKMFGKKLKSYISLVLIPGILFLSSCVNTKPQQEKKKAFKYNESKGISSLDPAFAKTQTNIWPTHQLFNGLVQIDSKMNIVPAIAKSWEVADSGRTYIFHLRNDVYFHKNPLFGKDSTRTVTAKDFVYSFNRILSPKVASPGSWIFSEVDKTKGTNGFDAKDDTTFIIYLKRPFPGMLGLLTTMYCSVVPKEVVEHYGKDFRSHPVGTGPFMFATWKEGEKLVLIKNPNYFERDTNGSRLPYLDAVDVTFVADKQSEFLEFLQGNIDLISGVTANNKDELLTRDGELKPLYRTKIKMYRQYYLNTEYLGFYLDSAQGENVLLNKYVRKAINYGFDRVKMMKYLRNNVGEPALHGFVPWGMPGYDPSKIKGYEYDQFLAMDYLDSAGYPHGKGLPEITLATTSDYLDLCEFIQHDLSRIGIRIKINVLNGPTFRSFVAEGKTKFFRGSWIADYPDPENYFSLFYSSNFSPTGPNYTHFHNATYDSLYNLLFSGINDSLRQAVYYKLDSIIVDEAPVVPLYYDEVIDFLNPDVKGFSVNPMNMLELKYVKK